MRIMTQDPQESGDLGWWRVIVGRLVVTYSRRGRQRPWGRFGGGWNWSLGFQVSSSTVLFNLLVACVRVHWAPRCQVCGKTMRTGVAEDRWTTGDVCLSCREAHEEGC